MALGPSGGRVFSPLREEPSRCHRGRFSGRVAAAGGRIWCTFSKGTALYDYSILAGTPSGVTVSGRPLGDGRPPKRWGTVEGG